MNFLPETDRRRRIYLMRHAHVDYFDPKLAERGGAPAVRLTPLGIEQAEASRDALAEIPFQRAICSGLPRTRQTAKIVLGGLAEPPELEEDRDFREIEAGSTTIQSQSREELARRMHDEFHQANEPGRRMMETGERFEDAYLRSTRGLERVLAEPGWHTLLLVAHEGINRLMLGWATGGGLAAVHAFEQDLACINVLDFDMKLDASGTIFPDIEHVMVKCINVTPYNVTKHGMNMTSLETIFAKV